MITSSAIEASMKGIYSNEIFIGFQHQAALSMQATLGFPTSIWICEGDSNLVKDGIGFLVVSTGYFVHFLKETPRKWKRWKIEEF